ncbi:DTW domain-containing protein [Saccharobesus litoralis]|uniref:tRNA-uridine aminocarboxypropyltransferase n=1 Tax=Saccharobesus litoralis TaxID=2172099 RepID=A0A2S0VSU6_9ALTE|nr:DTW domain-containing protein [Saccharobesus litoralis]AWB67252.1 DTW domain-containing protein [Saccharobesus litoralis]
MSDNSHSFAALKSRRLLTATKPFNARGKLQTRCESCSLATYLCACQWRLRLPLDFDFVVLLHRNEILKPTNTGRLISDLFYDNTVCFEWSRTEPDPQLLQLLQDPTRHVMILYPEEQNNDRTVFTDLTLVRQQYSDKRLTIVVLDGTWKQARRMMTLSHWLKCVPVLSLQLNQLGQYGLRKPLIEGQLATAEAAACVACEAGQVEQGQALSDMFAVFTQHYLAARACKQPEIGEPHHRLGVMKQLIAQTKR